MASIEINGGNVVYEILGKSGDLIALTPGGRFSKEIPGLRPLAEALADGGYRVLLWDRPNCGKSDVQFYGQSESHMRAETLHGLLDALGVQRCILAGGSGGARDSMLTTMLHPELVEKLVVWNIVGGVYGSFVLGSFYIIPSILAVRGTGMDGVVKVQEWRERMGSIDFAMKLLEEAEVAVSPGRGFGDAGEGYLRLALVENEQRLRQAVRQIARCLRAEAVAG